MRQVIEVVILAALLILLSVLPGYAQERDGATPTGATTLTDARGGQRAVFDAFLYIEGIDGDDAGGGGGGGGGGATPHCYEDEDLQMSICE